MLKESALPRDIVEAAAAYMAAEDSPLAVAYSGWAQCALPHRKTPNEALWVVESDRVRLVVEPGHKAAGRKGDGPIEAVGVPYGSYARLIMLYLQTEALRTNSREVELGGSWRAWMSRIGVPWGGSSGKAVREQADRIARCRLTFHVQGQGRAALVNQNIVDRADWAESVFDDINDSQGRLSLETAKLSEGFFEQLKRHPVPLEENAIKALANNSAALDVYIWLAYRLHSLTGPRTVTWKALKAQFGTSYKELYHFKARFPDLLFLATAVYPDAKLEVAEEGVILAPSRPPVSPRLIQVGS
ncbi:replication protein RepA [Belnapia arida]|uniref:replication protein RepA n=1 Tax=Belnapia arida TaxID=2804533 RepID=UPI002E2A5B4A|nr:replication protein RepA [Belnapia arida]